MSGGSRLVPALVLVAAVGAGCECFRDTPEQQLADRRWRQCAEGLRDVKLERVDSDGRIRFTYVALTERDRVLQCRETADRNSLRLPDAVPSAAAGK